MQVDQPKARTLLFSVDVIARCCETFRIEHCNPATSWDRVVRTSSRYGFLDDSVLWAVVGSAVFVALDTDERFSK